MPSINALRIDAIRKGAFTLDTDSPETRTDDRGRLHSLDGPAVEWPDGLRSYFIHGVQFDAATWEAVVKRTIPAAEAIKLTNVEQRRIALERLGFERVLKELDAKAVEIWNGYALYRIQLYDDIVLVPNPGTERQQRFFGKVWKRHLTAQFLHMTDPSTGQRYFLRVPPTRQDLNQNFIADVQGVDNCRDAVAWTFNQSGETWRPRTET